MSAAVAKGKKSDPALRSTGDMVDLITVRLENARAVAAMLEAIFRICDQLPGHLDLSETDGLWDGLRVVAQQLGDDADTTRAEVTALYDMLVPQDGNR